MDEWQKALVLCLRTLGVVEMVVPPKQIADVNELPEADRPCPLIFEEADGIHVRIVSASDAKAFIADQEKLTKGES